METFTIIVKDDETEKLIWDLEATQHIEIVRSEQKKHKKRLSDLLLGSVSPEQAEDMHRQVQQMRDEWERNTY